MLIKKLIFPILLAIGIFIACSDDKTERIINPNITPDFIDSIYPADKAVNVPVNCCISVFFLRPMDTLTVTAGKFTLNIGHTYSFYRNSMKAVICPGGGLNVAAEYEITVEPGIADQDGNVMRIPYTFSFRTSMGNTMIESIAPTNGQVNVPLTANISVVFTEAMDSTTINSSTFFLSDGVEGTISYANRVLTLNPSDSLISNHTYTVTLKGSIANAEGLALGADYTWTFTTSDISWPYITAEYPINGTQDVYLTTDIWLEFSRGFDPVSVTADEFQLSPNTPGTVQVSGKRVIFLPDENMLSDTSYTATFDGNIIDLNGLEYDFNHSWSFRTEKVIDMDIAAVFPEDGSTDVPENVVVSIRFTRDLLPGCVTAGEFRLTGSDPINGTVAISGPTVTFTPYSDLTNETYTAAFVGDIIDRFNDTTQINYSWTFTVSPFRFISCSPDAGCAPIESDIILEFSRPVDPSSVTITDIIVKESNVTPISGEIFVDGSTVVFRPMEDLKPLTGYKVEIGQQIEDIWGNALPNYIIKYFATRGLNLLPLNIGNKWMYEVTSWGYYYPSETHLDSICLIRDTIIDSKHYYIDQAGRRYRYENEFLEMTFIWIPLYSVVSFDNSDCEKGSVSTITIDLGTFVCQHIERNIWGGQNYLYKFNFAPGVGLVYASEYYNAGSGTDSYRVWELIGYELH